LLCTKPARLADHSRVEWILGLGAVFGSWAFLRALGSERQKRLREIEHAAAAEAHAHANPAPPRKA